MLRLAQDLWSDHAGFVVSAEMVLLSTVGVIGVSTGLVCLRDALNLELSEVGCAIAALDQSYCYTGFHSYKDPCSLRIKARTAGSSYQATGDWEPECGPACDCALQPIPECEGEWETPFRDHEMRVHEGRGREEWIPEDRVIPKPLRTRDSESGDDEAIDRKASPAPLKVPGPPPAREPSHDHRRAP